MLLIIQSKLVIYELSKISCHSIHCLMSTLYQSKIVKQLRRQYKNFLTFIPIILWGVRVGHKTRLYFRGTSASSLYEGPYWLHSYQLAQAELSFHGCYVH